MLNAARSVFPMVVRVIQKRTEARPSLGQLWLL